MTLLQNLFFTVLWYFLLPGVYFPLSCIIFLAPLVFIVAKTCRRVAKEARSRGRGKSKPWVWFYVSWMFVKCLWCVPITTDPQSAKSDTTKAHYQPRLQMVSIHYISISRCQLGIRGHLRCGGRIRWGIRAVLWSGMVSLFVVGSQILNIFLTGVVCVLCGPTFYIDSYLCLFSPPGSAPLCPR